ncbi:MAG TPA: cytochrome c3 family protein [Polyangiaceae bacterium]
MSARGLWRALLLAGVGAGALLACAGAPSDESAAKLATGCVACHAAEYRRAPDHVGEKPTACGVCHGQSAWKPTWVDHEWWALTGKHAATRCFDCHKGESPVFAGTKPECFACHEAEYAKAPGHAGKFPTTCGECHSTEAWKPRLPGHEKGEEDAGAAALEDAGGEDAGKAVKTGGGKAKGRGGPPKGVPTAGTGPVATGTGGTGTVPTATPTAAPTAKPPPDTISTPSKRFGGRR